ncbi:uncharacterized protein F5891DRAFT_1238947 [Suillus fuscotomentosus]|uniref:Helicase ATP-binding domain-containing protein n=1 Tax=Suillus fuscotomentosus TaxID=1912939 RepID=A0AAD4EIJ1_9AGAM|nr:uncharacterized protein F5891DRAFT_1238947 [Suillus fuscotomentosus]KAG1906802.1 hypothetical protein F5891DRAFT_1238947 [Suillus fuscotomentosus]
MRIGYSYIPPSHVNRHPIILDWFADDHVGFTAIEDTHIKVTYVQEPSDVGYSHHSVYLNTRVYPGISVRFSGLVGGYQDLLCTLQSNQFVVPNGWRAKVTDPIANLAHNFFLNPEPHLRNILLDPVVQSPAPAHPVVGYTSLSPVATLFTSDAASLFSNSDIFSISENNWMNPAPVSPAASSIPLMLPPYDKPAIHVNTTLLPYGSVIGIQRLPVFIGCNLQVFTEGISYTSNYLKSHFTAAWTIISNARLMGRNYLTINIQGSEAAFKSYCVQVITEMQTIGNASPQPPESGLQCHETGETEILNLLHPDIIEILYAKRSAFIKSMRTCAQSFVEEPKKTCLGGFSLKTKTSEEAKALIQHLTNMTDWSSDVTSIAFMFDSNFNPYHNKALLAMLAHRIIRPIHGCVESLLTLFPESYTSIPKHLISRICALALMSDPWSWNIGLPHVVALMVRKQHFQLLEATGQYISLWHETPMNNIVVFILLSGDGFWGAEDMNAVLAADGGGDTPHCCRCTMASIGRMVRLGWFGELPGYSSEAIYPQALMYGGYVSDEYWLLEVWDDYDFFFEVVVNDINGIDVNNSPTPDIGSLSLNPHLHDNYNGDNRQQYQFSTNQQLSGQFNPLGGMTPSPLKMKPTHAGLPTHLNSIPDINTLSSSTVFPSSTVWIQSLSYASLTFSILAAFGAVLGKQWLNSYKGLTVVISPLIALMKDQVDALVDHGVKAANLDSILGAEWAAWVKQEVVSGHLKLLYVAPERLNNEGFIAMMSHVKISLLAIDESHCILQWGASFQPEYLKIVRFAEEMDVEHVLCLTATTTPNVAEDICKSFFIDTQKVLNASLALQVQVANTLDQKLDTLIPFLKS